MNLLKLLNTSGSSVISNIAPVLLPPLYEIEKIPVMMMHLSNQIPGHI